jgi:ribosomal protein L22
MKDTSELLNKAIDDASNESLMGLTTQKINELNLKVINELQLSKKEALDILRKLNGYKYADEMDDLKYGTYIRWIKLDNPDDLTLTQGAIFTDIKITDQGVNLICKNFGYSNKRFTIKMDECLIFRKLTNQELVLLSALDHLSK